MLVCGFNWDKIFAIHIKIYQFGYHCLVGRQ